MPSKVIDTPQETPAEATSPVDVGAAASSPPAEPSLDELLAQYEQSTAPAPQQSGPISDEWFDAVRKGAEVDYARGVLQEEVQQHQQQVAKEQFEKELASTVSQCRGSLDTALFPDDLVIAWIDAKARRDEQLQQTALQRNENPRAWAAAKQRLAVEFQKYAERFPDPNVTEDREAVAAVVRGASAKGMVEQAPDFTNMPDAEFNKWKIDHGMA